MKQTFDEAVAMMVRDYALVSDTGKVIDTATPRPRRRVQTITSLRRLYAPLAMRGRGPRGGDALSHVIDTWLHHPDRRTVYPGELEYPLQDWEWFYIENESQFHPIPSHLKDNPNRTPYVGKAWVHPALAQLKQ